MAIVSINMVTLSPANKMVPRRKVVPSSVELPVQFSAVGKNTLLAGAFTFLLGLPSMFGSTNLTNHQNSSANRFNPNTLATGGKQLMTTINPDGQIINAMYQKIHAQATTGVNATDVNEKTWLNGGCVSRTYPVKYRKLISAQPSLKKAS